MLISIVLIRALTELTNQAWIAYLITSGIFLLAGALLMIKGTSAAGKDLEKHVSSRRHRHHRIRSRRA